MGLEEVLQLLQEQGKKESLLPEFPLSIKGITPSITALVSDCSPQGEVAKRFLVKSSCEGEEPEVTKEKPEAHGWQSHACTSCTSACGQEVKTTETRWVFLKKADLDQNMEAHQAVTETIRLTLMLRQSEDHFHM